jgi:hypothetical protein
MTATKQGTIRVKIFIGGIIFLIAAFGTFRSQMITMTSPLASVGKIFQEGEDKMSPMLTQHVEVFNATQAPANVTESRHEEEDELSSRVVHHVNASNAVLLTQATHLKQNLSCPSIGPALHLSRHWPSLV